MKLSEPQKRVLRAMAEFDSTIFVVAGHGRWDIPAIPDWDMRPFRPRIATLRALRRLGFLQREWIGGLEWEFFLTPKGREAAKTGGEKSAIYTCVDLWFDGSTSRSEDGIRRVNVSRSVHETQARHASHITNETQAQYASQRSHEAQKQDAKGDAQCR